MMAKRAERTAGLLRELTGGQDLSAAELARLCADPELGAYLELAVGHVVETPKGPVPLGLFGFQPRPDQPEQFDQQSSFVFNRDQVAFLVKGNAAGGTEAAAYKTACYLLQQQPPPRKNTPFWVISDTYEQVCDVCWSEKLLGHGYIPESEFEWDSIQWLSAKLGQPKRVPLRPWPVERGGDPEKNWMIEFKSYEQGRTRMQARSIGGFWFSEQFPWDLFLEVLRGCREYMFRGGQFCEFTPIDPTLCIHLEKVMDSPPAGWAFYRGNTACNRENLAETWYDQFFGSVPEEMLATRQTGALAVFEGAIYPSFQLGTHMLPGDELFPWVEEPLAEGSAFPRHTEHARAGDWGDSEDHATVCLWGARHVDTWVIYDEYWSNDQAAVTQDHAVEIVARSAAWGWPLPKVVLEPTPQTKYFADRVMARLAELTADYRPNLEQQHYGYTYADSARPGEIREFCGLGIPTTGAAKDVHQGIDAVRTVLKVSPFTGRPRLLLHKRCVHLRDELRQYRWSPTRPGQPHKVEDDTVDTLRYLIYSHGRAGQAEAPSSTDYRKYAPQRRSVLLERTRRIAGG